MGVDAAAVEGAPASLGTPAQVGHDDVGVEMGIEGPTHAVHEGGGGHAVDHRRHRSTADALAAAYG